MQQNSRPPPIPPSPISFSHSLLSSLLPSSHSSPKAPISCSLPLFIILFPLFILFISSLYSYSLAPSLSPSRYLSYPEAHVSLLALHTITSIHQLYAYFSLASPLPFLCSITTTPTILHTHLSLQPPCLTSHPLGQLSVPPHTLVLLPLLPFSLPSKLTPPVAVSHTRCP